VIEPKTRRKEVAGLRDRIFPDALSSSATILNKPSIALLVI